jgi:hypothetical protein
MFADRYRALFDLLGFQLQTSDAVQPESLENLNLEGLVLPKAVHDYLLVAGNEVVLNRADSRLLSSSQIFVDAGRIVFMEDNLPLLYWGVMPNGSENPIVEQGLIDPGKPLTWFEGQANCAEFFEVMLCWQASYGRGMKFCAQAKVTANFQTKLNSSFRAVGRIWELFAFARAGCALVFLEWHDDRFTVFAGFATEEIQTAVGAELGLVWLEC